MGKASSFPLAAEKIGLEWPIEEGGIGITARTDETGQPYIGLYPLDPTGQPAGECCEFPRSRLMIDVVAGYRRGQAIVVYLHADVTERGLDMRVIMPVYMARRGYPHRLSASWEGVSLQLYEDPAKDCGTVIVWPFEEKR